ncbi:hypothetical protein ACOSP7_030220 [Xanthoceras sorbifolium]
MGGLKTCSYLLLCLQLLLLHSLTYANLCSHEQSSALLQFKQLFSFDKDSSNGCYASYPKMKYWKEDTDCCTWDGVTCDTVTGHVIGLDLSCSCLHGSIPSNSSLFLLSHLQKLNLAYNDFNLSQIPSDFFRFRSLTHLNLSSSYFSGKVPFEISHLSKLVSLDLFGALTLETLVLEGLVQNLTQLEELSLDGVNMSTIAPGYLTNLSSSLTWLSLSDCQLQGSFPENIFNLPNLQTLDLQYNYDLKCIFPKVSWSSSLRYLDVSYINFSGKLPDSIENLKFLSHLNMENCNFMGQVPGSIGNLTQLSYLNLGANNFFGHIPPFLSNLEQLTELFLYQNNFNGEIPDIFINLTQLSTLSLLSNSLSGPIPSSLCGLRNLAYISLDGNRLDGTIPSKLFSLPSLKNMRLDDNKLSGHIDEFQSNSLEIIGLSNNRLHGPIPSSIFELVNLTFLWLGSNNLSGTVEFSMFVKFKKLEWLDLSHTNLLLTTTIKVNSSFPKLNTLGLSSCNINEFPEMLSDNLQALDLSDNKIHGHVPNWLFSISTLSFLNLSHNFLTGLERFPWENLLYLDLHSNLLQGQLPAPPPFLQFFFVSNNNMTGAIPSLFCNLSSIEYLDLSNNSFYGMIPQCLGNFTSIIVLNLKTNNFHGTIPRTFANDSQLKTLNLNGNRLEGPLPPTLANCGKLEVLDVGNNMINDTFPHWLAALPQLQVLILRSNRFYGPLGNSKAILSFSKLRILDLSHNGFSGHLQMRFFKNFQAMMSGKNNSVETKYMGNNYYRDYVMVTIKGVETQLERILTIFSTMDLSRNKFRGPIPNVVGKLNSLIVLNFSHNSLTDHIPLSLENLAAIESLDLSSNKLDGKIPMQLTSLTFLSLLNLSYNKLGNQFQTFPNDSYFGNLGLCGLPLSEKCSNDEPPEPEPTRFHEEQDTWSWFDWKIIMMGYGNGLVIGLSMGYIVLSIGKPWWFVSIVERKVIKLTGRRRRRRN